MSKKDLEIVDDDTLFLLMALKHQGNVVIKEYESVYTYDVNYDETVVNPDVENLTLGELANNAIEWMSAKFGITSEKNQDEKYGVIIELTLKDKTSLEAFLSEYLSEFIQSDYYESEEKHKKALYEYLKDEDSVVIEFPKKVFTYRFLEGNKKGIRYKMIEYLMYLLGQNILTIEGIDKPFSFNNDGKEGLKKVIKLQFDGNSAEDLFFEYFEKQKQEKIQKERASLKPIAQSSALALYEDNRVSYKGTLPKKISERYCKILKYCLQNKDEDNFLTVELYKATINSNAMADKTITKYFSELNKELNSKFGLDFNILNTNRKGRWKIRVE